MDMKREYVPACLSDTLRESMNVFTAILELVRRWMLLKAVSVRKDRECLWRQVKHITNISSNLLHNFRASVNILRSIKKSNFIDIKINNTPIFLKEFIWIKKMGQIKTNIHTNNNKKKNHSGQIAETFLLGE